MRGFAVALLAVATIGVAIRWGSFVAGGSDSYCYIHQAQRWADVLRNPFSARLQVVEPLALEAPWPDAPLTFAPVGHVPSTTVAGAIAPICPSGLALAMAPLVALAGPRAAFAVVPLFGALLILATYVVGSRFGARVGVAAAVLAAASPIFLYQVVQPMSDVPAAALWTLAVAWATSTRRHQAVLAGLATSGAVLMRPNLLPLGFVIGLFLLFRPERTWRGRTAAAGAYAAASAVGCIAVALIQWSFFGSPLAWGYGSVDSLFSTANIPVNARSFLEWLMAGHTPAIALALLAPILLPGALTAMLLAMFFVNAMVYLAYVAFPEWSYLRFLLPTIPLLLVLMVAGVDALAGRAFMVRPVRRNYVDAAAARMIVAALTIALAVLFVREAQDRQAFRLHRLEGRFERAGRYVGERLPSNAVVFTAWHSGSVRFYGDRTTIVWDALDEAWLDRAVEYLERRGYEPYFMFEGQEERRFRERFRGSRLGALDWPPAAEIVSQVRLYRPADQEAYRRGVAAPTEYVR